MDVSIDKIFAELGRLHVQVAALNEENAALRKRLEPPPPNENVPPPSVSETP